MRTGMGRLFTLIAVLAACNGSPTSAQSAGQTYRSVGFEFAVVAPGHTEGVYQVSGGTIVFKRAEGQVQVSAEGTIIGYFWSKDEGSDTSRVASAIWPPSAVLEGRVTDLNDSTFKFVEPNYPSAWPVPGDYVIRGDTLVYTLQDHSDSTSFLLRVKYLRER